MSKFEIGVVVNYYNPTNNQSLIHQTLLSALSYRDSKTCAVTIVDGSGFTNEPLKDMAIQNGIQYLASDKSLRFAEGYNIGIDSFIEDDFIKYIILSANDIIVPESLPAELLSAYLTNDKIGCVIPYLTKSDYYLQNEAFLFRNRYVPLMTLNCNFFNKKDLITIGKVPEYLSGYFNDVVMSHYIHQIGKRIMIAKRILAIHLVSKTVSISSSASSNADWKIFKKRHAELTSKDIFLIKARKFSSGKIEHFFSLLINVMPITKGKKLIDDLYYITYDIEAVLFKFMKSIIPMSWYKSYQSKIGNNQAFQKQ